MQQPIKTTISVVFALLSLSLLVKTIITPSYLPLQFVKIVHASTIGLNSASTFFTQSANPVALKNKFNAAPATNKKVKILLVAGHEPKQGGAEYKNLKERNMTVELAQKIANHLSKDPRFEVVITRDQNAWNPLLATYFTDHKDDISSFTKAKKEEMNRLLAAGKVAKVDDGVQHVDAPSDVALRLYGINKWSNENGVDFLLHIHFNEYPRSKQKLPGKYYGFTIYVPDAQYSNAQSSSSIANYLLLRLASAFPVSNLPKEDDGIVEDQNLVAIGYANTLDSPSVLIEYGYIYDPIFATDEKRAATFDSMAKQTYLGLEDFFAAKVATSTQP